jgi:hypothetical protein
MSQNKTRITGVFCDVRHFDESDIWDLDQIVTRNLEM